MFRSEAYGLSRLAAVEFDVRLRRFSDTMAKMATAPLKAAEFTNAFQLAVATYGPEAHTLARREFRNALLWERLRGIAWEEWTA